MTSHTIGVDISKDQLDAYRLADGAARTFPNTIVGAQALIGWMGAGLARVVFEPTGAYHAVMERALGQAGAPVVKVNPRQARRFAEAIGQTAKTDLLDAAMLARMGAALDLPPRPVQNEAMGDLKALIVARNALVKDRTAAKNRAKIVSLPLLKRQNAQRLDQIDRQIKAIDAELRARIQAEPVLNDRFTMLLSIPGVGEVTACALLIGMPELGALDAKQVASLAGLAPVTRQSGKWTGKAFIRGGRADLRQALYMPALVAIRFNPDLKAKYDQLIAAGKPAKVAITAIMRKLIILANALIKANRHWMPKLP